MVAAAGEALRVEALGPHHDRSSFKSGAEPLDRYLRTQAGQDARKNMAAPFVLVLPDGCVGGYYTLSSTSVQLAELPEATVRRLPYRRLCWAASRWIDAIRERAMADSFWPMLCFVPPEARSRRSR